MDVKKEVENLTEWIRDYVYGANKTGVVIGMSGGIDSAVSFELAVRALGKKNVTAVSLPIVKGTHREEYGNSHEISEYVFEKYGVEHLTIPLSGIATDFDAMVSRKTWRGQMVESGISQLTHANIQARLRMTALYATAEERGFLVIGTGNKSEHAVGYFTKWGDGGVDFEPLGDYYKDEVYELARELGAPDWIINAEPSANLWEGQTDEAELGMSYPQLDSELRYLESKLDWLSFDEGFEAESPLTEELQKIVKKLIDISDHKRRMPPVYMR